MQMHIMDEGSSAQHAAPSAMSGAGNGGGGGGGRLLFNLVCVAMLMLLSRYVFVSLLPAPNARGDEMAESVPRAHASSLDG